MFFIEDSGNCVYNCLDEYYKKNNTCLRCHENCKKCLNGPEINDTIENQNCESCKEDWKYLVTAKGFNKNCVNKCPEGTI